jgi:glycosyltransferase involved in cell wall biosynthesis
MGLTARPVSTIYLSRNGLLEPLGQSQVLSYLRLLSGQYRITVISYEKSEDWSDKTRVTELYNECRDLGILWLPQRFRPQPKIIAPAVSMFRMTWLVFRAVQTQGASLIHARSYIPAAVAMVVGRITGVPFIFDMRALWLEELITAGRLRRGSWLYRLMIAAERACLHRAAAVVSLTRAAVAHLRQSYPKVMDSQTVKVIPTCADLGRFTPASRPPEQKVIGCLGTVVSGWFQLDWLAAFLAVAAKRDPTMRFQITTRDDPDQVRAAIGEFQDLQSRLSIEPASSKKVHEVLQSQIASIMFFTPGLGKLGSSPTRMAEILGCGLPVIANDGVGDVAEIIRRYRVGVIVSGPTERDMEQAWDDLQRLLVDRDIALRCRRAAEDVFSLEAGAAAYSALYEKVVKSNCSIN